jgi:hypothetical protein
LRVRRSDRCAPRRASRIGPLRSPRFSPCLPRSPLQSVAVKEIRHLPPDRRSRSAFRRLVRHSNFPIEMIRKLRSGQYRLYSRKIDPKTGKRRNLGTFKTRAAAEKHEKAVQFFKRRG